MTGRASPPPTRRPGPVDGPPPSTATTATTSIRPCGDDDLTGGDATTPWSAPAATTPFGRSGGDYLTGEIGDDDLSGGDFDYDVIARRRHDLSARGETT